MDWQPLNERFQRRLLCMEARQVIVSKWVHMLVCCLRWAAVRFNRVVTLRVKPTL
jgi:hypothetical protein